MPKVHHVKKAAKDNSVVKKGEPYYWWKVRTGPASGIKMKSAKYPRPSQLTRSDFMSQFLEIGERIMDFSSVYEDIEEMSSDASELLESAKSDLENLRDETQDKLDNMPDALQDADTGMLLSERIQACEDWLQSLESVDPEDFEECEDLYSAVESAFSEGEAP